MRATKTPLPLPQTLFHGSFPAGAVKGGRGIGLFFCLGVVLPAALLLPLFLLTGCEAPPKESDPSAQLLTALNEKVSALEREGELRFKRIAALEEEVSQLKRANSPIFPVQFRSDTTERDDPFFGPADAPLVAMVFFDYESARSREFAQDTLAKLREEYANKNDLKVILRDYPLANATRRSANFANCVGEQGEYWSAHEQLIQNHNNLSSPSPRINGERLKKCLERNKYMKEIEQDLLSGTKLGVVGVPAVFIGTKNSESYSGVMIRGAQPLGVYTQEIRKLRP